MVDIKLYLNHYHDKALIVNDNKKTFEIVKASDLNSKQVALRYKTSLARMREVARTLQARGYVRGTKE